MIPTGRKQDTPQVLLDRVIGRDQTGEGRAKKKRKDDNSTKNHHRAPQEDFKESP
jgi:hypothetical protein